MDIEQIIQWSRDAGFSVHDGVVTGGTFDLKAFAKLVAAHEREAIAAMVKPLDESLADEILARGNNA
jgi:hypothetical protein